MKEKLAPVLERHPRDRSSLIPLLQDVQDELGYLPPEAMREVARHLNLPESNVYGVVTFYAQFHLTRQGRHRVKVCQGTACHVRGGKGVMDAVRKRLGIEPGGTTPDYRASLERVACFGSCALAPVMVVDDKVYGKLTPRRAVKIIEVLE